MFMCISLNIFNRILYNIICNSLCNSIRNLMKIIFISNWKKNNNFSIITIINCNNYLIITNFIGKKKLSSRRESNSSLPDYKSTTLSTTPWQFFIIIIKFTKYMIILLFWDFFFSFWVFFLWIPVTQYLLF